MSLSFGVNQALVEDQLRKYIADPSSVDSDWREFFESMSAADRAELAQTAGASTPVDEGARSASTVELAWRTSRLVAAFRSRGHYYAKIDPLGLSNEGGQDFDLKEFGIAAGDVDVPVTTDIGSLPLATPRQIVEQMRRTYCGTIGYELMHVEDRDERNWLLEQVEARHARPSLDQATARRVLQGLTNAQELERFIHNTYIGVKRFSLEGLEAAIPMLESMIADSGGAGIQDIIVGMAHRGRLNVLVNILEKSHRDVFVAFNDEDSEAMIGRGDVKYHLGHNAHRKSDDGSSVRISLCFNPSHLEFVNPVVVGRARARTDARGTDSEKTVLPVMIHGDAAFIGQGVVIETLNLAELEGYRTGGSIHIVLNNQVGFTTSPSESRSSRYASDVVRFLRIPVFHVNAEDMDSVIWVSRLALEYRQRFGRDVCIDLVGYRKFGHNEGDEPRFTQPKMYSVIDTHTSVRDAYAAKLVADGLISQDEADTMVTERRAHLSEAHAASKADNTHELPQLEETAWHSYLGGPYRPEYRVDTGVPVEKLRELARTVCDLSDLPNTHPKISRIYAQRADAVNSGAPFDWGTAEMLAYASLIHEGRRVRISGQDCRRGTFSHRHSYVVDGETGASVAPLNRVAQAQGDFEAYDSPLSEAAVLGFEYGYSLEAPSGLVVWEAQFGDFANGAQVIIDQFIVAGEDKWGRLTGLVLLLPHGFEGMGPEHSYARLGRFLQLCAEDCMQVCDVTTPAQFFHLMRRQVLSPWRKPLVVMSPKSLLRHKRARSVVDELANGEFQTILPDVGGHGPEGVRRILLCSGRVYYDSTLR